MKPIILIPLATLALVIAGMSIIHYAEAIGSVWPLLGFIVVVFAFAAYLASHE